MARRRVLVVVVVSMLLAMCRHAGAEWSSDPAVNLAVGDRSGPQVQPKLAATAAGGFYLSWFDNSSGGYDVYLQRLSAAGVEQWSHNGVLVADRSYDWTQEYGLAVDTAGHALLAFGGGAQPGDEITVARVDPNGNLVWGPDGVPVASGSDALSPRVAGTSDGNIAVAWTQGDSLVVQKLDPDGAPLWGSGVTFAPPYGIYFVADLQASDAGNVIVSFEWGTATGSYTQTTDNQTLSAAGVFSANLTGLTPGTTYYYRVRGHNSTWGWNDQGPLEDIVVTGLTGVAQEPTSKVVTAVFEVGPNPVTGLSRISYALARSGSVSLNVYDATGRRVLAGSGVCPARTASTRSATV